MLPGGAASEQQKGDAERETERERERERENRQLFALPQHNKLQGKMRAQLRARASEANNIIMLSSQRDGNTLDPKSKAKRESNSERTNERRNENRFVSREAASLKRALRFANILSLCGEIYGVERQKQQQQEQLQQQRQRQAVHSTIVSRKNFGLANIPLGTLLSLRVKTSQPTQTYRTYTYIVDTGTQSWSHWRHWRVSAHDYVTQFSLT